MNAFSRGAIAGCLVLLLPVLVQAGAVEAGQLRLVFSGGTVSIDADAVPLREILEAWATLGGTRIDGLDRLPESHVTLHVEAIAEDEALAALLEGRNAFATVPRKPGEAGASRVARIALFSTTPATGRALGTAVPADWPFPVNTEHPDDVGRQPPTNEIIVERPGIEVPWPFPVTEVIMDTPAEGVVERPGIDVPWPFPVNNEHPDDVARQPPTTEIIIERPGIDVPWPFPVTTNPVDADAPAPVVEPAAETPRDQAGSDQAAAEPPSTAKKPTSKTKGAPVSTKAPKPIPPRKRP